LHWNPPGSDLAPEILADLLFEMARSVDQHSHFIPVQKLDSVDRKGPGPRFGRRRVRTLDDYRPLIGPIDRPTRGIYGKVSRPRKRGFTELVEVFLQVIENK
jgi:hypothetical protein